MPIEVTNIDPKAGQPKTYKSFSRSEVKEAWKENPVYTFESLQKEHRFVVFFTDKVEEALVVAASFMRELITFPQCTYYDSKIGALLLFYGDAGPVEGDDKVAESLTKDLIERIMKERNIGNIDTDPWGDPLFWRLFG